MRIKGDQIVMFKVLIGYGIGGNVIELSSCSNSSMDEFFQEKPSWCRNEQVCQGVKCKAFERSNELDTALYIQKRLLSM